MTKRKRVILLVLLVVVITAGAAVVVSLRRLEPRLHAWVTTTLSESLESEVELERVHLSWMPLRLSAEKLTVRHHGRTDIPPLLVVSSFAVDLRPLDLWSSTVEHVVVDGMEINIPPKDPDGKRPMPRRPARERRESGDVLVRRLTATNTRLAIHPRQQNKNAKVWDIFELDMTNVGAADGASFTAALINPVPYGKIETSGRFGPWQSTTPGDTPISGEYTFAADLGTIRGLAGQLSASGDMAGTLDQIATRGQTHTPDFRLTELDGASVPLETSYDALVDGTEGDVQLKQVDFTLGESKMAASGVIEGTQGLKGKRVILKVTSTDARLGELLRLVSNKPPPVTGRLMIDAALDLPQGDTPVLDRVELAGRVRADRVTFTNDGVQEKIDELSRRAQGRPHDEGIDEVASRMAATFTLRRGVFTYRALSFDVRGAKVSLDGTHSLKSKAINLQGVALLHAPVSKTQTGFRSWLLKPFDPLFRKGGAGTRLAIKVEGTQDQPKVGLDFGKTLRGR